MTLAICLIFVGALAGDILFYQGTKHTVTLKLDGKEQVVRSHSATVKDMFNEMGVEVQAEDSVTPSIDSPVTENTEITWEPAREIEVNVDGKTQKFRTTKDTVGELLQEQGIKVTKNDSLHPKKDAKIEKNMEISIEKAFPLHLTAGGEKKQVWSTSTTVADFLKQQGIVLNEHDRVKPDLDEKVTAKDTVIVTRVEKVTDVVEETVDYSVEKKEDKSIPKGQEEVVKEGRKGLISRQYEVVKEDGKEVKRQLLSEKVVKKEQNQVVAVGAKAEAASKPEEVHAVPVSASSDKGGKEIYVSSTAYTASCSGCSGVTTTGMNLKDNPHAKVIAVDPSVIPLGSKVYVEGYGYAVAADKGGAIKGNKIDVFFSSKSDAYRWGVKRVKVQIVD
ncbi:G5 and 3D domain-containing protein [Bacillus massiliglaciei]|uniref:G5 and 3D domain-containing protein n=1 Tax=Bacillus massiliglaciei TaxID=1816693 RepID=UPI000A3F4CA2|nr:G5 and 3D domain-containing protein [Bacillus massiliglaciei]